MAINTDPISSLAGTFWMQINAPNTDANAVVMSMGDIRYEFDLVPTDAVVRGISGIQGSVKVDFFDQLSNRGSLYASLEDSIGTYDGLVATTVPVAPTTLYLLPRGESNMANAYRWPFDLRFTEVSIDERSQTTTATFIPRSTNITINTWNTGSVTNNFPATDVRFRLNGNDYQAYYIGDFIYDIISEADTGAGNTTIYLPSTWLIGEILAPNTYNPYLPTRNFVEGQDGYAPAMIVLGPDHEWAGDNLVASKIASYAAIDQSVYGSAFGVNFFMGRRNNQYNVELSNSDLADVKFRPSPRSINAAIYTLTNTNVINASTNMGNGFPALYNTYAEQPAWAAASQQINTAISVYNPHLNFGTKFNTAPSNIVNGDALYNNASLFVFPGLVEGLWTADAAVTATYTTGVSTSNTGRYMIEADILGVDKIRPYEVIKFDNTVPLRYQGKHFRPTSVSYDLKADRVRVTAYQIDTFVIPGTNVNVNVGDCESGAMVSMFAYNTFTNVFSDENGNFTSDFIAYNTFTNVFSDEFGNVVTLDESAFDVTAFSNADGNVSNVTGISI